MNKMAIIDEILQDSLGNVVRRLDFPCPARQWG